MNASMLDQLSAEFPRDAISWRAQSVTKDGSKAMALAYIDARDVMERLDAVCGPAGWQCDYPHAATKTVCRIGIKIGDEWVWKANGAGDSDIEAEKGALSDAFKRAAVLWGIGRYLYNLDSPWVPCESYEQEYQGRKKQVWKRWKADPWSFIKGSPHVPAAQQKTGLADITTDLLDCHTIGDVDKCAKIWAAIMDRDGWSVAYRDEAKPKFAQRRKDLAANADDPDRPNTYANAMRAG